jgi:FMN-dependent NADH-azoreductase
MKRILFVTSSLNGHDGASSEIGSELVDALVAAHPGSTVTALDLGALSLPHLASAEFTAWSVPAAERSPDQAALAARSDRLIEQLVAHDTLVLGVPMYNMTIPSTLKAWIDRVVRAGRTFRYTADGPEGLLPEIDAYAVFARGGVYRGTPLDTQTGYIQAILGLIGIGNVKTIFAEGLAMGEDKRHEGLEEARGAIAHLAGRSEQEVRYANA